MKIGEAGEAFFVFETDEDVPDELITSPLLTPKMESDGTDAQVDRFGARKEEDSQLEPDFLDLDAQAPKPEEHSNSLPSPPSFALQMPEHEHVNEKTEVEKEQDERADAVLKRVAIDTEGYHSQSFRNHSRSHESHYEEYRHDRDASDRTVRGSSDSGSAQGTHAFPTFEETEEFDPIPFPPQSQYRATSEPPPDIEVSDATSYPLIPSASTPTNIPHADSTPVVPSATPKSRNKLLPGTKLTLPPQEFTWEWGGFPTPSPMKASFNFSGRPAHQHNTVLWGRSGTIDVSAVAKERGD
ncbi:hypothetical protein MPER_07252 [Moniliophthora perniciosa FA553]|nr:hypothetical protein MPER_07252 [Moniliophthora perniciosa FA553]